MSPAIRPFTRDDIAPALQLCRSAGWNQLHADWSRLIEYQPNGCFVAELDGRLVGTVTTTCYGTELAWIGMMLVHPEYRRRGIGTELMNAAMEFLLDTNVQCVKLDATPEGQLVYERLGFQSEWSFHRWARENTPTTGNRPAGSQPLSQSNLDLDRTAFAVDRSRWLDRLADGSVVRASGDGFAMFRPGYLADYLGPVVARTPKLAGNLINELLSHGGGKRVFWDVVNSPAAAMAESLEFRPVRDLTRMWTGSTLVSPPLDLQYAISDPGTG